MRKAAPILWEVLEEHLDDGAFLWEQRERALGSPRLRPAQVVDRIEERLLANVEGLAVAAAIDRVLLPALGEDRAGTAAVAALALLELRGPATVLEALRGAGAPRRDALVRALALSRRPALDRELLGALGSAPLAVAAAAVDALALRRADAGTVLPRLLAERSPELRAAALRAASWSSGVDARPVEAACDDAAPAVRLAAIESGLLLGLRRAYAACQHLAASDAPEARRALLLLSMSGVPGDAPALERALDVPALRGAALVAIGHAGRPSSLERALALAASPDEGRLAGEAFSTITGIAVEGPLLAAAVEDQAPPPLEEDDLDASLDPGNEGELPAPEPQALAARWRQEAPRFDAGARYLGGRPFSPEALLAAFREGSMRRRRLLGLELAIRSRRALPVDTEGWAAEQVRAEARLPPPHPDAGLPFSRSMLA